MKKSILTALLLAIFALPTPAVPATMPEIKAYCLDFNWQGSGRRKKIADPGFMKDADSKAVVEWHKAIGSNVIQTFCVAHNGYAYYRNDVTPEQPGLKHDFLREVVRLGHAEGLVVMGYFSIAANVRWAAETPDLSYDTADSYHIPYTDEYLAYVAAAVTDAARTDPPKLTAGTWTSSSALGSRTLPKSGVGYAGVGAHASPCARSAPR